MDIIIKIKQIIFKIIYYIYPKIFNSNPGPKTIQFLKNMIYIYIGFGFAKIINFFFQILLARTFEPIEYGKITLIISISLFMQTLFLWGLNVVALKYIPENKDKTDITEKISTSINMYILIYIVLLIISLIYSKQIGYIFAVNQKYIFASIFLGSSSALFIFAQSLMQSIEKTKYVSLMDILKSVFVLLFFIVISFVFEMQTVFNVILLLIFGYIFASCISTPFIKEYYRLKIFYKYSHIYFKFGFILTITGIMSTILSNFGTIIVNKYLGLNVLGVFQAHNSIITGVWSFITMGFMFLFVPEFSKNDKYIIMIKLKKLTKNIPLLIPIVFIFSSLIFTFYGPSYKYNLLLMSLLTISNTVALIYALYSTFLLSTGLDGVKINLYLNIFLAIIYTFIIYLLLPIINEMSIPISSMISFGLTTHILIILLEKEVNNKV